MRKKNRKLWIDSIFFAKFIKSRFKGMPYIIGKERGFILFAKYFFIFIIQKFWGSAGSIERW